MGVAVVYIEQFLCEVIISRICFLAVFITNVNLVYYLIQNYNMSFKPHIVSFAYTIVVC